MTRNETYARSGRRGLLAKQSTPAGLNPIGQQVATAVRRLRKDARYSVRTLAGKTGFSPSFISQIENGQASPSIASLERIAQSFGVGLSDFFETLSSDGPAVVKAREREVIASAWSRATLEGLGTIGGQAKVEAVMITLNEEGSSGKKPHARRADQLGLIIKGEVLLTLEDSIYRLGPGDSARIPANTPHRWANGKTKASQFVLISCEPYTKI